MTAYKKCLLSLGLVLALPAATAQQPLQQDGIPVQKMSGWRNFVPAQQIEAQALQQYSGLKTNAQQQGALIPESHPQVIRLRAIARRLIPFTGRWNPRASQWQWEVNLLNSKQVNAFCMPGGKIAFYTGILTTLKLTDDEVAIVMGHEIAHALREHGREQAAKSGAAQIAAQLAGMGLSKWLGVDPNLTHSVTGGAAKLAILSFSRADETEADLVGLDIAARAGFDPRAGIALWQKMAAVSKGAPPQWLSTHPAGQNRIGEIRKHLPQVMPLFAHAKGLDLASLPPYQSNLQGMAPIQ